MLVTTLNVNKDSLYAFLIIFDFVQVLTISINQFAVSLWGSNWRTIIHNSKGWSDKKCWKNSNASFWLTRLMTYQRQKTKKEFLSMSWTPNNNLGNKSESRMEISELQILNLFIWRSGPTKKTRSTIGMAHCARVIWRLSGLNLEW